MSERRNRIRLAVLVALIGPAKLAAQCGPGGPRNPPATRNAIVGVVMDSSHTALEGATVFIRNPLRQARTSADGRFRIDSLPPGVYELTARRFGHETAVQSYSVLDSGGVARFCLIPEPRGLAPMITSVSRGGLSGFVGDSTYAMVSGAEVRAVAGGAHAITDSAGGFFLPLKPGAYAIIVKKEGFGQQFLSVTVPPDSGRQIAVWLSSPPRNARRVAAAIEDSMKFRLLMERPVFAKFLSSEDVMRNPADLTRTVQAAAIQPVPAGCEAIIDGGPFKLPLGVIDKSEIAAIEVYAAQPSRSGPTSINPGGTGGSSKSSGGPCNGIRVYVWLKP